MDDEQKNDDLLGKLPTREEIEKRILRNSEENRLLRQLLKTVDRAAAEIFTEAKQ
jgi:hypothetical protein